MSTYIDHYVATGAKWGGFTISVGHSWRDHTARNLAWRYGPERAAAIMAGNDPATQSDLKAWRQLGQRSAA